MVPDPVQVETGLHVFDLEGPAQIQHVLVRGVHVDHLVHLADQDRQVGMSVCEHLYITGVDVAKKLFELGFTKLRLLSGQDFEASGVEIPDYLMVLPKSAAANLDKYF